MALDPVDVETRFGAFDRAATMHRNGHDSNHSCSHDMENLIADAERLYQWATYGSEAPTRLIIWSGSPYEQGDPAPENQEGAVVVAVTMTDTQQVDLNVQPVDSKGQPTDDANLTWSVDDSSVLSLQVDPNDNKHVTCVAGNPGVATVTVSDGTITGAEAFTITSGPAAAFNVEVGTPSEQSAAAPSGGGGTPAAPSGTGTGTGSTTDVPTP